MHMSADPAQDRGVIWQPCGVVLKCSGGVLYMLQQCIWHATTFVLGANWCAAHRVHVCVPVAFLGPSRLILTEHIMHSCALLSCCCRNVLV